MVQEVQAQDYDDIIVVMQQSLVILGAGSPLWRCGFKLFIALLNSTQRRTELIPTLNILAALCVFWHRPVISVVLTPYESRNYWPKLRLCEKEKDFL